MDILIVVILGISVALSLVTSFINWRTLKLLKKK